MIDDLWQTAGEESADQRFGFAIDVGSREGSTAVEDGTLVG